MIPRPFTTGTACLALLSGFEQILCFAAAAPAPRVEARPKHYFPRHVKRIVTNGTQSQSQSQTSTTNLDEDAEKSTSQSEISTRTPTTTLDQLSSQSLTLPLESLLTSLIPAAFIGGVPFIQSPTVGSASPSSADSAGQASFSIDPNILSLSITPPGIVAPSNKPSLAHPLSSVAVSSSSVVVSTASTFSSSFSTADFQSLPVSPSAGTAPLSSNTQSLFSKSETSLVQTISSRSSSQSFAEPASTTRPSESSQTSFASAARLVGKLGADSSITKSSEEVSSTSVPTASISSGLGSSSSPSDSGTGVAKSNGSASRSVPSATLSSLKTDATELGASVTAPPKTVPISSGILGPSQPRSGDFLYTKAAATDRFINGFIEKANNEAASSRIELVEDNIVSQSEQVTSSRSGTATQSAPEPTRSSVPAGNPKTALTESILPSNSSAVSAVKEDKTAHDTRISKSATEISFALFGANTIVFSTSKPTRSSSAVSSPVSSDESAARGRNTITKSGGADITASESFPRNTNNPQPSEFVQSTFNLFESAGVRITATLSSITPEKTAGFEATSVEPERSASITRGVNGSAAGVFPGEANTGKRPNRPDVELPGFDDFVTLGSTTSTGVLASSSIKTPQQSISELAGSDTKSTQASASAGTSIAQETKAVKRSSEFLFGSGGSFTVGQTAPLTVPLPRTTSTAGGTSVSQSGNGASASTGESASSSATKSKALDGSLSSDIVAARPTVTTSGDVVVSIPVITSGQAKPANPSTAIVAKPDFSDSALLDSDSSTRLIVPEKSITAGLSESLGSELNVPASSVVKTGVSISQTIPEQLKTPTVTLSDRVRSTLSESEPAKPSKFAPDAFAQESNRPGTELPEEATASLPIPSAFVSSSQIDDSLPESTGQPRSGPPSADTPRIAGLGSTKTSNIEVPEATEPSASQSSGSRLDSSGSVITSGKEPATVAANGATSTGQSETKTLTEALPQPTGSISEASTSTADQNGSPIVSIPVSIKPSLIVQTDLISTASALTADRDGTPIPSSSAIDVSQSIKPSLTVQTDPTPEAPASTADRDGSPIPPNSAIDTSLSIKPSSASPTDAFAEKPTEGPSSATRSQPQISVPSVTDLPQFVEPSFTGEVGLSSRKTAQISDGSSILIPGVTNLPSSIEPSIVTKTDSSTPKVTPTFDSPGKAPQTNDEPLASDLPSLTESRATQTGSSTDKAPPSPVSLVTDLPSSVPLPSVTDLLPAKETSRSAQTDLASEKPASSSGLPGGLIIPGPSATDSPPAEPSPAKQTFSASASETVGEAQPSAALPISISVKTGAASATEDTRPIVLSRTPSLSSVLPPESVQASRTDNTNPFTAGIPVVTTGPATTRGIPAEPSKLITAPDNQATDDKLATSSSAGPQTGLPVVVPISASPPVPSSGYVASPPSSGTLEVVPITASPAVSLTTKEPAKPLTNSPPAIAPQPSETSIASPPIPIDQSTFTAPATSKISEVPASSGGVPPVIILPSSALGSETSGSAASAPTGGQSPAKATPGDTSVTAGVSSAPILVGISDILTASSSNAGVSSYSPAARPTSTPGALSSGIIVEPSGVSPSAGGIPTGALVGSASATSVESVASNPAVTASYSSAPVKAEGSGASGSPAVSVTSAVQTSNEYLPSGAVSAAASSVETSKPTLGSEVTASLGGATPVQATAQSTGTSGGSTTPGAQLNLVQSSGTTELISGAASETGARGAQPSSAVVSSLPSSVPNDLGSLKPGSTANVLPPSAAASAPSTVTSLKEGPKTELIIQSGSNVAVPTATDSLTAQPVGSSILAEPSASMPTATADFPTGIPSSVPRIISPPNGVPEPPDNTTLCQIGFLYPLNYKFVLENAQSQRQIFKYLPQGIADGLSIPLENVTMQTLRAYDTTQDLHYITTLALFFIPSQQMDLLSLDLHTPAHHIYNNTNASVKTIMSMINPAIPLKGDNWLGTPWAPDSGKDGSSTSTDSDPGNEGVPISGVDNSSPVRAKSVGIAAGVVCGAAAYGAAMFFVARRYRKRKQSHRRSPSMLSSPVLSGTSHDYTVGANTALMSGGRGDGDRSLTPHNGYYYERNSRGSGHSGSTGRQQISAPVMAENSLGWN